MTREIDAAPTADAARTWRSRRRSAAGQSVPFRVAVLKASHPGSTGSQ